MSALPYEIGEPLLQVRGVSMKLGGTPVLRDVSAEIRNVRRPGMEQGQVVALLGPSGVGKTTLFRILAGLDQPDSGTVRIGPECEPVRRGSVGVVAQNYPLFQHRTVLGNLTLAARKAGLSEPEKRAMVLLERFGVADHARKYPSQLSGGQRQRVAISQQLLCSEHFLLMDEPFSGLDPVALERVIELIDEVSCVDELKTLIVVTHDIAAAVEVADTIWLLGRDRDKEGKIIPGARIQATYDLKESGLAWRKKVASTAEGMALLQEIREAFSGL